MHVSDAKSILIFEAENFLQAKMGGRACAQDDPLLPVQRYRRTFQKFKKQATNLDSTFHLVQQLTGVSEKYNTMVIKMRVASDWMKMKTKPGSDL